MTFLDVVARQAHPGERRGHYPDYEGKLADAREFRREERIPWTVLVDDLAGTVHQTYGGLSDPVYLIDATGRVAFYGMWTNAPMLKRAIDELLARGGEGAPVAGGIDHTPHIFASFVGGWPGIRRGGWRGVLDYELSVPGAATMTALGHLARPLLAPLAQRATPLPTGVRLAIGGAAAAAMTIWLLRRRG